MFKAGLEKKRKIDGKHLFTKINKQYSSMNALPAALSLAVFKHPHPAPYHPLKLLKSSTSCTVKNICKFYGKMTGNQLPVHFPLFLQASVNIFRNQAQYGSIGLVLFFGHIALQPFKGICERCRLTY